MDKSFVFFMIAGVLFFLIGLPLALGRVRPNALFGFKAKILSADAELWYPVNRAAGLVLVWGGLGVLAVALVLRRLPGIVPDTYTLVGALAVFAVVILVAEFGKRTLRRLYYAKYENGKKAS